MFNTKILWTMLAFVLFAIIIYPASVKKLDRINPFKIKFNPISDTNNLVELGGYQKALLEAKKSNKELVLVFGAKWCGACGQLKNTLNKDDVKEVLSNFVVYYVDVDIEKELVQKYKVSAIPHYFKINYNEVILKSGIGYLDSIKFIRWLKS